MERKRSVRRHRKKKTWWQKCKEYLRQIVAFLFSNVGIIGLVVGYTIAGSFIFMTTEGGRIEQMVVELQRNRSLFVKRLWNITFELNNKNLLDDKTEYEKTISYELAKYQNIVVHFTRKGFVGTDDINTSTQWSFAGAFLYSLTVITTIGYGNIYPHTPVGKIATIIYAIIGMPLFLLYLSNIGDIMARSFKWIYANCCLCRWCPGVAKRRALRKMKREQRMYADYDSDDDDDASKQSSKSTEVNVAALAAARNSLVSEVLSGNSEESYDVQNVTVPLTICLVIMVGYICGGALLFCKWESKWSFMDASYFCFISLSTIGFGDLVPGDKIYGKGRDFYTEVLELSFVFCSIYLMLGMALIAMCFNLMQEEVIHKSRATIRTIKYIFRCNR